MTGFVAEADQGFAKRFKSDTSVARNTKFTHIFYDGNEWTEGPVGRCRMRSGFVDGVFTYKKQVGWHVQLFKAIIGVIMTDLHDLEEYAKQHSDYVRSWPKALIICPLARSAGPLSSICRRFWDELDVDVVLGGSTRGRAVDVVHTVRHRRFVGPVADQYNGIQKDPKKQYVNDTRGKTATYNWFEAQPFGDPLYYG